MTGERGFDPLGRAERRNVELLRCLRPPGIQRSAERVAVRSTPEPEGCAVIVGDASAAKTVGPEAKT